MPDFIRSPSPNFNERDPNVPLRYVVLHYTGMKTAAEARQRLCDPQAAVSAHYLIEEDGTISLLVEEDQRAWHAGESYWRGITDMNSASIGIELVNPGHQFGYHPFAATQINRLKPLLHQIIDRHHMDAPTCLLAHADIAPRRKEDPGELFPWRELALDGLGSWPMPQSVDYGPAEDSEIHVLLRNIGYDCPESEGYDRATRAALLAFQRHYQPDNLTGTPEKETIARLRALSRDSHARN